MISFVVVHPHWVHSIIASPILKYTDSLHQLNLLVSDFIQIIRPSYMMFYVLGILAGFSNGSNLPLYPAMICLGLASFLLLWFASYTLNDLYDANLDKINKLKRALPEGRASPRTYKITFLICSIFGILISLFLPTFAFLTLLSCWLLGIAYSIPSIRIKKTPILAMIPSALSYSLIILYGSLIRGEITHTTIFISVSMGFFVFIAANAKDIGDIDGDLSMGGRTLPMIIGAKPTAWITLLASTTIGVSTLFSYLILPLRSHFLILTPIAISILIAGGIYLVRQSKVTPISVRRATGFQSIGAMLLMFSFAIST